MANKALPATTPETNLLECDLMYGRGASDTLSKILPLD
jgi:hypothetical protein